MSRPFKNEYPVPMAPYDHKIPSLQMTPESIEHMKHQISRVAEFIQSLGGSCRVSMIGPQGERGSWVLFQFDLPGPVSQ